MRGDNGADGDGGIDERAQLSMPVIEVAVGVTLILALVALLALGTPAAQTTDPQLDVYAADVGTLLAEDEPRHEGTTRLDEVTRSEAAFEREADALEARVDELLPDNLFFRIETPHGTVGFERPDGVHTGIDTVTTQHGTVRIEVWYP